VDGGRHWASVTDDVADAAAHLTGYEPGLFDRTPLAIYVPGELQGDPRGVDADRSVCSNAHCIGESIWQRRSFLCHLQLQASKLA